MSDRITKHGRCFSLKIDSMPELPEVETIRQGLMVDLPGKRIEKVEILRSDSIGYPGPQEFAEGLKGHRFVEIRRRGKYLLFSLNNGAWLVAHLRMSGRLLVIDKEHVPSVHLRVRILLAGGSELHFEDMRVFGRLWYIPAGQRCEEVVAGLAKLGIEPFANLKGLHLKRGFRRRTQPIKTALLDQSVVAGLGNIYADEVLFHAGIHPLTRASELTMLELNRLALKIKTVLREAIRLGGSSLRNYTDARGVSGNYQQEAWVYGRAGKSCRICTQKVVRVRLAGRSCHFCPHCQSRP